jgi:PAS domain S-box-containing protein
MATRRADLSERRERPERPERPGARLASLLAWAARHPVVPTVVALVAAVAAAEWVAWLHAGPGAAVALTPATGIAFAVALLLPWRRAVAPLAAVALAVVGVALRHHVDVGVALALGTAAVLAAVTGALLLRFYADGDFRVEGVRDLVALVVAALAGGVLAALVVTGALAWWGTAQPWWQVLYRAALADMLAMVLLACATVAHLRPRGRRLGGPPEAVVLAVTIVATSVLAIARWGDPLAFVSVVLLVWAAVRFGTRAVALGCLVMLATADWALARGSGTFAATFDSLDGAVLVVQAFFTVTMLAMLGFSTALEERDSAEAQRWVAAERSRRTFDHSPAGIAVTTLDGVVVEANRALCRLLGRAEPDLVGRTLRSWRDDDTGEHEALRPGFTGEPAEGRVQRFVRADGEVVHVELSEARLRHLDGAPDHKVVFVTNVTERTTLRHQLVHAQKMESVGRLAGGIAHDFNNVLAIMRGQVELLQDDMALLERARKRIDSVQRATDRAAALTDDLMTFSRRSVDEPETFDLHELLQSLRELVHQIIGPTVALELQLDADASRIVADPNRLEQAVMNLAVNARDAMPTGGNLTLGTTNVPVPGAPPYVVLTITDTGIGMDHATRQRVFEPFFTTKPPGRGTGLGMSTTADIVKGANATIEVRSELGHGTTFLLTFPTVVTVTSELDLRDGLRDGALAGPLDDADAPGPAHGTVLVVDDEPEMRTLVAEILRGAGYRVLVATDGDAALAMLAREPVVDLLVTDVVMPVMSGTDLAARVAERSPSTRVLFVSGFVPAGAAALRGAPLLTKPLRRNDLLDAARRLVPAEPPVADSRGEDSPAEEGRPASAQLRPDQGSKR